LSVKELNKRYLGLNIDLSDKKCSVDKIEEFKNGVKISLKEIESGKIATISRGGEPTVFGLEECEKFLLKFRF